MLITELRRGWWRITDEDQLRTILENLHSRGVRERELKRILSKYIEHTVECSGKVTISLLLYKLGLEQMGYVSMVLIFRFTLFVTDDANKLHGVLFLFLKLLVAHLVKNFPNILWN
jgi:hypothetical protein